MNTMVMFEIKKIIKKRKKNKRESDFSKFKCLGRYKEKKIGGK